MSYLGLAPKATESLGQGASNNEHGTTQSGTSEEAKKIAAAALAAVKDDAAMAASSRGKLVVSILLSIVPIFGHVLMWLNWETFVCDYRNGRAKYVAWIYY